MQACDVKKEDLRGLSQMDSDYTSAQYSCISRYDVGAAMMGRRRIRKTLMSVVLVVCFLVQITVSPIVGRASCWKP